MRPVCLQPHEGSRSRLRRWTCRCPAPPKRGCGSSLRPYRPTRCSDRTWRRPASRSTARAGSSEDRVPVHTAVRGLVDPAGRGAHVVGVGIAGDARSRGEAVAPPGRCAATRGRCRRRGRGPAGRRRGWRASGAAARRASSGGAAESGGMNAHGVRLRLWVWDGDLDDRVRLGRG